MFIDPYSVIPLLLIQLSTSGPIGNATGFLWRDPAKSQYYLVTNYHVLSGRHPVTGKIENSTGIVPTSVRIIHNAPKFGEWVSADYPVVDGKGQPLWKEHPKFGHKVDVVLLPIDLPSGATGYAINDRKWVDMLLRPAEIVSIIGFPHGETAGRIFAIWQTGYVASEPELDFGGLPVLLVDSRAWPGNSGSPVIARRYGSWSTQDGGTAFGDQASDFVGIYSGRLGKAEMKYVWKRSVIDDILK